MNVRKHVLCIVGTRPEGVKMAPLIKALKGEPWARVTVLTTAQHRNLLDQVLTLFNIRPDVDLDIMRPNQTLPELTARLITALDETFDALMPDVVLAQGDTTTVMTAALVAFYRRIPFGHVEAGLLLLLRCVDDLRRDRGLAQPALGVRGGARHRQLYQG